MAKITNKNFVALKIISIKAKNLSEAVIEYNNNHDKHAKIIKGFADSWEKGLKNLKKYMPKKSETFIVNSKDLFDKKKNPHFSLSVKDILKNKKIKKQIIK